MSSVLFRTGSGPINSSVLPPGAPRFTIPHRHDSFSSCEKYEFPSLLHLEVNNHRGRRISRAISEPQALIQLRSSISSGSQSSTLPEVVEDHSFSSDEDSVGSLMFAKKKCFDSGSGRDGFGSRPSFGGNNNNDNNNDNEQKKICAHYQKMLKSNPNDPLILRNYGKFLHEVEGDTVKAEECYGRAILASPGDGELLSLYGKLIWDTQRDGERAQSYFDQAVIASPDDCVVMGSYAQFMWEAEDEDEEEEEEFGSKVSVPGAQPMVAVF